MPCVNQAEFAEEENPAPKTELETGVQSNFCLFLSVWQLSAVSEVRAAPVGCTEQRTALVASVPGEHMFWTG